jgi:hypothetical protein
MMCGVAPVVWTEERIVDALQRWMAVGGDSRIVTYKAWTRGRENAPADVTIAKVFGSCGKRSGRPASSRWGGLAMTGRTGGLAVGLQRGEQPRAC